MTIAPIVATVAMLEPVTAPNAPHATTEVIAIPPGTLPIQVRTAPYRSVANPVWKTSCPMSTNSGIVTNTKLRPSDQGTSRLCANAGPGPSRIQRPAAPVIAIANAIGTPSMSSANIAAMPMRPLMGSIRDFDGGTTDLQVGPVTFGLMYCDHVVIYRFTPLGPDTSDCDITWLVRGDAEEGRDYDKDKLIWLWDVTTHADKAIIERNAQGVSSRYYKPGPLSEMEDFTWNFLSWYLNSLKSAA